MKRSEMVKKMCNDFYELNKYIFDDSSKRLNMLDVAVCMDDFLSKIEEAGMLPPQKDSKLGYGAGWIDDPEIIFYSKHSWEPENEEK
jgi:CRISPR/Cas system CSM-associated protein Csm5 (group 7 of RAMP superfamily)